MRDSPAKASGRAYKARSGARVGMGTSPGLQRLLEPLAQTQTNVWGLDRVGVSAVSRTRGEGQACPWKAEANHMRARITRAITRPLTHAWKRPFAPPPHPWRCGGLSQFFLPFLSAGVFADNSQQELFVNGH